MAARKLTLLITFILLQACSYDLDFSGMVYTPYPANERFEQSRDWFMLHPARMVFVQGDSYSFFIGGDSHIGTHANISRMIDSARIDQATGLIIAGDITTGREEDYAAADSLLDRSGLPVFLVPGNHDLYFSGWESYYDLFGPSSYTVGIQTDSVSDLFIFLDTGGGTLGSSQFRWLTNLLENDRDFYRHAIVITHLNFIRNRLTGSTNPLNEELGMLFDLFNQYNVAMVIQGHDHKRYIDSLGNTAYITLDALVDGTDYASYMRLDVNGINIDYSFVELH